MDLKRISRLVAMLGSANDNERNAAHKKLVSELAKSGKNFSDLAALMQKAPEEVTPGQAFWARPFVGDIWEEPKYESAEQRRKRLSLQRRAPESVAARADWPGYQGAALWAERRITVANRWQHKIGTVKNEYGWDMPVYEFSREDRELLDFCAARRKAKGEFGPSCVELKQLRELVLKVEKLPVAGTESTTWRGLRFTAGDVQ
jgi:hypothetical protein